MKTKRQLWATILLAPWVFVLYNLLWQPYQTWLTLNKAIPPKPTIVHAPTTTPPPGKLIAYQQSWHQTKASYIMSTEALDNWMQHITLPHSAKLHITFDTGLPHITLDTQRQHT